MIIANGIPIPVSAEEADSVPAVVFEGVLDFFDELLDVKVNPGCDFDLWLRCKCGVCF